MLTWRERIDNAQKTGKFTAADYRAWCNERTCLVGEVTRQAGFTLRGSLLFWSQKSFKFWDALNMSVDRCQARTGEAVRNDVPNAPRVLGEILDKLEDNALALKRAL
jgi:hypothetical protein